LIQPEDECLDGFDQSEMINALDWRGQ